MKNGFFGWDEGDVGNRYSGFGTEFHMVKRDLRCFGKFQFVSVGIAIM